MQTWTSDDTWHTADLPMGRGFTCTSKSEGLRVEVNGQMMDCFDGRTFYAYTLRVPVDCSDPSACFTVGEMSPEWGGQFDVPGLPDGYAWTSNFTRPVVMQLTPLGKEHAHLIRYDGQPVADVDASFTVRTIALHSSVTFYPGDAFQLM